MTEWNTLADVAKDIVVCPLCPLCKTRTKAVPGEGNERPDIMFIGEAPGFHEDRQGRPFVGPAGMFLEELLTSIGLKREDVFITNVVKCRPPENRDPRPLEINACAPYLERQTELLRPKIVVTLGRFSMAKYFATESISRVHGMPRKVNGIIVFPMYHPAAALHQPALRRTIEADMLKIPKVLAELSSVAKAQDDPKQLPLL